MLMLVLQVGFDPPYLGARRKGNVGGTANYSGARVFHALRRSFVLPD
jgi:hypothetical protein